jgi:hypothetical protein
MNEFLNIKNSNIISKFEFQNSKFYSYLKASNGLIRAAFRAG